MPFSVVKFKAARHPIGLVALLALMAASSACGGRDAKIRLPENPVLSISSRWGVVNTAYLRVKTRPSSNAPDLAYMRKGEIVEVQSTQMGVDTLEAEKGHWYGLATEAGVGWAYSGYLEVYDARVKADLASEKMGR
jgi:hypothetical protein